MSHHPPLHPDESEPIALNPLLRGVDLAVDRLIRRDCFTGRTLDILDELREELLAVSDTYSDNKDIPLPTESVNSLNIDLEGDPQMTLDDLRKIAEQATKGPWEWERPSEDDFPQHDQSLVTTWKEDDGHPETVVHAWGYDASGTEAEPRDRLFIATFNPAKVLELIDQLATVKRVNETNRGAVEILEARLAEHEQAVENMSTKTDDLLSKLAAVEKLHQQSSEQTDDAGVAYTVCVECTQINRYGQVRWPCLTIKAVRGE